MEFNEKLQKLRKSRSLTQEELAEALFVSRTAVSKWESGRGYPSIDSLKDISRFFSVTIDELICSDEMILVAEHEKKVFAGRYLSLICNILDIFIAVLFFIPVFGNGQELPETVPMFGLTGISIWLRIIFISVIGITVANGIFGVIVSFIDKPVWCRHRIITGIILSVTGIAVFILARQPYAGILWFSLLVIKGFLIFKMK